MTQSTLATLTSLKILFPLILILCATAVFLRRIQTAGEDPAHTAGQTAEAPGGIPVFTLACVLFGIYLVIYFHLTFTYRHPAKTPQMKLTPFWSYREAFQLNPLKIRRLGVAREILLNILLTIPEGLLQPILYHKTGHPWRWTLLTVLVLTVTTETVQYFTRLGLCELDDVFNNLLGGLLGMGILAAGSHIGKKIAGQ